MALHHLCVWVLVTYGLTLILTGSKLFAPARALLTRSCSTRFPWVCTFVSCPLCVGTWVGMGASLCGFSLVAGISPAVPLFAQHAALRILADGWAAGGACFACHVVLARMGAEDL